MAKSAIYTVLLGGYETLKPAPRYAGWDSIAFVDDMGQDPKGWTLRHFPVDPALGIVRTSRLPRILPHHYLPEYDRSVYIDASVTLKTDPASWGEAPWIAARHWERDNVWQEFEANRIARKGHEQTLAEQAAHYKEAKLERGRMPLTQNCVILRDHQNDLVKKTNEAWWKYFDEGSARDQLSLPKAFFETGLRPYLLEPRPKSALDNHWWSIRHIGAHATMYQEMPLFFLVYNLRGSAISRGLQIGRACFDRGLRNEVVGPDRIPRMRNATVVVVKEWRPQDIRKLKEQGCRVVYDVVDNATVWDRGLGDGALSLDAVILPCAELEGVWTAKGFPMPPAARVIHHHGDTRFSENEATEFRPVCISTHTQIPQEAHAAGVDCITEENGWEGLFEQAKEYNLHIGVYAETGPEHQFKPPSKLATAAACGANIILQRLPSNIDLLPESYPYYVDGPAEIPAMLEKARADFDGPEWERGLAMLRNVRERTTARAIAAGYDELFAEIEKPEKAAKRERVIKAKGRRIALFWHIARMGNWQEVVAEQASLMQASGLLDVAESAMAMTAGEGGPAMLPAPFHAVVDGFSLREYEFPTLELLYHWAKRNPDAAILYFHTKGVSDPSSRVKAEWRKYMGWGCIERWRDCLDELEKHDTCGVEWFEGHWQNQVTGCAGFYAGNFWWANATHLAKLPDPRTLRRSNRWEAEAWIAKGRRLNSFMGDDPRNMKPACIHNTGSQNRAHQQSIFGDDFCRASYTSDPVPEAPAEAREQRATEIVPPRLAVVITHYRLPEQRLRDFVEWNRHLFERDRIRLYVVSDAERQGLPDWCRVIVYREPMTVFNLSKTSNFGIRRAIADGAEVIVKTDPDILFPERTWNSIVTRVQDGAGACPVYRMARTVGEAQDRPHEAHEWHASCGTIAMTAEDWRRAGFFDERMEGYGIEDGAMYHRATGAGVEMDRMPARPVMHIAHSPGTDQTPASRGDQYNRATGFNPARNDQNLAIMNGTA